MSSEDPFKPIISKISGSKGITNLKTGISNIVGDQKNKKRVKGTFSPIKKQKKGD